MVSIRERLSRMLSPVLALEGHGLEAQCAAVAAAASAANAYSGAAQEAFLLDDVEGSSALKDALTEVAREALCALSPDFPRSTPLDVRLSLRRYPAVAGVGSPGVDRPQRLGAHVDSTLCTLLWSTGPGLEVLAPSDDDEWTGADVANLGLPTMGADPKVVGPNDWATVDLSPWTGALLFTPGHSWDENIHTTTAVPLRSPTLHRVCLANDKERLSLPLLVSLARDDDSDAPSVASSDEGAAR